MKPEQLLIKTQKALHILREQGFQALINRLKSIADPAWDLDYTQLSNPVIPSKSEQKAIFIGKTLDKSQLVSKMRPDLSGKQIRFSLSHDDYLENVGGLQLNVADEQAQANKSGTHYLHLFPYGASLTLAKSDSNSIIGLNLDGKRIGFTEQSTFLEAIPEIIATLAVEQISLHHLMGFDLKFVEKLISLTHQPKVIFWLHDFFSICPGYLLLRNNLEFCGAPDIDSNACSLCVYGGARVEHLKEFERFFAQNSIEVRSPSAFALDLWKEAFPVKDIPSSVCPHAFLENQGFIQKDANPSPLKFAFVGFPVHHKGWAAWLRLTQKFGTDPRYEFFLFSEKRRFSRNFKNISVSVTKNNRNQMAEVLQHHAIDVAFLWSICPETFSYTLYESLSAGCYVVTNRNSGNIQAYVKTHPGTGLVLDDEQSLMELFSGDDLVEFVAEYQKEGRPTAQIVINRNC